MLKMIIWNVFAKDYQTIYDKTEGKKSFLFGGTDKVFDVLVESETESLFALKYRWSV